MLFQRMPTAIVALPLDFLAVMPIVAAGSDDLFLTTFGPNVHEIVAVRRIWSAEIHFRFKMGQQMPLQAVSNFMTN